MALKQNDTISALEFHTREMDTYYNALSFKNNLTDKIIMAFKKYTSSFGTKPFYAIGWFVGLHTLWIYFEYDWSITKDISMLFYLDNYSVYLNKLAISIKETNIFLKDSNPSFLLLLKSIASAYLVFEIIKSFRKFSKK